MPEQLSQPTSPRARAIHSLRNWVETGQLGRGDALPSERALAAKLEVGRATIRRALRVLQAEGLILDRGGHIRTVAPPHQPGQGILQGTIVVLMPDDRRLVGMAAMETALQANLAALALGAGRLADQTLDQLIVERPMGVVAAGIPQETVETMRRGGLRVVVDADIPGLDRAVVDHEAASHQLTKWLIVQGRRRILTLWRGLTRDSTVRDRLAAHERALREANLQALPPIQIPAVTVDDGAQRFEADTRLALGYLAPILAASEPPDAIMAETDVDVAAVAHACRILGKEVGKEVLLVGYGGEQTSAVMAATVDLAPAEVGRALVRLLMDRAAGRLPDQPQRIVVKPRLVVPRDEKSETTPQPLPAEQDQRPAEPLFGWKMEGGRWTLGKKK